MSNDAEAKRTILVIDDERAVLNAASFVLSRAGYIVISAESGQAGLAILEKRVEAYKGEARVALVIVDWKMPGADGLQVITEIRGRPYKDIPIILMSGAVTRDQLLSAAAKSLTSVLLKPLVKEVLLKKVGELIGPGDSSAPPA